MKPKRLFGTSIICYGGVTSSPTIARSDHRMSNTLTLAFVGPADISQQALADNLEDFLGIQRDADGLLGLTRSVKVYLPNLEGFGGPGVQKVHDWFFNAEFSADEGIDLTVIAVGEEDEEFDQSLKASAESLPEVLVSALDKAKGRDEEPHVVFLLGDDSTDLPDGVMAILEDAIGVRLSALDLTAAMDAILVDLEPDEEPAAEAAPTPEPEPVVEKAPTARKPAVKPSKPEPKVEPLVAEEVPLTDETAEPAAKTKPRRASRTKKAEPSSATEAPTPEEAPEPAKAPASVDTTNGVQLELDLGEVSILAVLTDISNSLRILARQSLVAAHPSSEK